MVAGQALIVSRIESHMAVLQHARNALFFELDNPQDLARQILTLLADENLRLKLSESARDPSETQFSNSTIAEQLEDLYKHAIVDAADWKNNGERRGRTKDLCNSSRGEASCLQRPCRNYCCKLCLKQESNSASMALMPIRYSQACRCSWARRQSI